jgi:cobalt transporter subunit CbtB
VGKFNPGILTVDATAPRAASATRLVSARVLSAVVAMLLGAAILFVAGFSSNDFVHAAAHDVRHASGFPCH